MKDVLRKIRKKHAITSIIIVIFIITVVTYSPSVGQSLEEQLESIAKEYNAVGIQAVLLHKGNIIVNFNSGTSNIEECTAVNTNTVFRLGRISEIPMAMTALAMYASNIIDINTDISEYWDTTVGRSDIIHNPVTIYSLLTHTSTIVHNHYDLDEDGLPDCNYYDLYNLLTDNNTFAHKEPGDFGSFLYNPLNYAILGMTLEQATNTFFEEYLQRAYWSYLSGCSSFNRNSFSPENIMRFYDEQHEEMPTPEYLVTSYTQGYLPGYTASHFIGGMYSNANSLALLADILINDGLVGGMQYLPASLVSAMENCFSTTSPIPTSQGISLSKRSSLWGRNDVYYVTATSYGMQGLFSYDKENGDAVIVLTQGAKEETANNGFSAICNAIAELLYAD